MSERIRNLAIAGAVIATPVALGACSPANNQEQTPIPSNVLVYDDLPATPSPSSEVVIVIPSPTAHISDEKLERRLERDFDITILNTREYSRRIGEKPRGRNIDWTVEELTALDSAFSQLPDRFSGQNPNGEDLEIVLLKSKLIDGFCDCMPDYAESDGAIGLSRGVFDLEQKVITEIVAHEAAHGLQPWKTDKPGSERYRDYTSPWVTKRDSILGNPKKAARKILGKILEEYPAVWEIDTLGFWEKGDLTEEEERELFASRLFYGIGFSYGYWNRVDYDTEFFAVMVETYVKGPEKFFARYGQYMSQDQTEEFYAFVNKIFRGTEYRNGVMVKSESEAESSG